MRLLAIFRRTILRLIQHIPVALRVVRCTMKNTQSLCLNYRFRQLYNRGKSQVASNLVVYCSRNREKSGDNRLGLTVSTKVGKAVVRNSVRRKLREAYRLHEDSVQKGLDIVIVARTRASSAQFSQIEKDMLYCFKKLGILMGDEE